MPDTEEELVAEIRRVWFRGGPWTQQLIDMLVRKLERTNKDLAEKTLKELP